MRHELAISVLLLLCAPCVHAQEDPAYVDSPANKSRPDPARADGGVAADRGRAGEAYVAAGHPSSEEEIAAEEAARQEALAEIERMTAAHVEAAYRGQQQGMAAAMADQPYASYDDPPIGGRSLLDDVRRESDYGFGTARSRPAGPTSTAPIAAPGPEASARQQIGSALMQDAGGLIDNRVQREIYGSGGRVYLPGGTLGP